MRCNLNCTGCYAGKYQKSEDLPDEIVDDILRQAKELGIYFIVVSGGEPYLRQDMWLHLFEKYNDMFFLTFTNGTLIDENLAKELARLGNVAPGISVEGFCEETDERRGKGVYEKVMKAMDNLKKEGCLFGFSATVTKNNNELLSSEEFIKFYIDKGAKFGWYFMFMPVGKEPDVNLIPTPQQRLVYGNKIKKLREKYPIFAADFWNDGPAVGGCMAGRSYMHILYNGNVEPCVFTHFAIDNVKQKSLKEIFNSDFFKFFREKHPYSENKNLMTPCAVIDNPEILREAVKKYNAFPSHEGSDAVINDPKVVEFIDNYSKEFKKLTDPIWEKEFLNNPQSTWYKEGENYKKTFIDKE
jgi:MoaA/NifB/PqqE/SkfB family radical SAM enzyme